MKLKSIKIKGFRGINQQLDLSLDSNLIVFHGDNGSGKTSIFQAIQWGLFGKLDLAGEEFRKEDAIVNDFALDNEAVVTMLLDDGTEITRIRKKGKSTGFGKTDSTLTVKRAGATYVKDAAQALISDLLKLTADEMGLAVCLQQETIRDFIEGGATDRSQTVDKMIGIINLRELIAGIDLKSVNDEIAKFEKRVEEVQNNTIQATVMARDLLINQENDLIAKGISKDSIVLSKATEDYQNASTKLSQISRTIHSDFSLLPLSSLANGNAAIAQARATARTLQGARIKMIGTLNQTITRLTGLSGDLDRAVKDLESTSGIIPEELETQKGQLGQHQRQLTNDLQTVNSNLASLRQYKMRASDLLVRVVSTQDQLKNLGDKQAVEQQISEIADRIKIVVQAGEVAGAMDKLLPIAKTYLTQAKPDHCPVCKKQFEDVAIVINDLTQRINSSEESLKAEALRKEYTALFEKKRQLEKTVSEIIDLQASLSSYQGELSKIADQIKTLIGVVATNPLDDFLKVKIGEFEKKAAELSSQISQIGIDISTIDGQLRNLNSKRTILQSVKTSITRELNLTSGSDDLAQSLQTKIAGVENELTEIQGIDNSFTEVDQALSRGDDILRALSARDQLSTLEKEYPVAELEKTRLQAAIGDLRELKLGLQDIYQAATEHQRTLVVGLVESLMPLINERFSKILGHPEYSELQIIPEEEKKGVFKYWIGAKSPNQMKATYVVTRFSTAQRNAAAIAIFLAMSELLPHELNVLMIDEPNQSMHPARQDALAKYLADVSESKQVIIATEMPNFAKELKDCTTGSIVYEFDQWDANGTSLKK